MRRIAASLVAALALILAAGCNAEPCDKALDTLDTCLAELQCKEPATFVTCSARRQQALKTVADLRRAVNGTGGLACNGQIRTAADRINDCPLNVEPATFCGCP